MSKTIAKFEKISWEQFLKDFKNCYPDLKDEVLKEIYQNIKLPCRATTGSAGYDFFLPVPIVLDKNKAVNIPTAIKCSIDAGWVLNIYPRSGHGFKHGISLANTVGIIDSDYYNNSNNEGHIFVKLVNSNQAFVGNPISVPYNTAFCQGVFLPYGLAEENKVTSCRTGGFGSTNT